MFSILVRWPSFDREKVWVIDLDAMTSVSAMAALMSGFKFHEHPLRAPQRGHRGGPHGEEGALKRGQPNTF